MNDVVDHLNTALEGRYQVERELGQGGMATVYLARDLRNRREVAIKVLRPDLARSVGNERFLREIEIAGNLNHPHVLALFDSGEVGGMLYYVMPLVEGETLRDRLDRENGLPVQEVVRILTQVADALGYAHSRGVVHRDIKPSNVMLSGRHAVVADFGVAKAVWEGSGSITLTDTGVALGTPAYMAPEQVTAEPGVDHRADIYSLGVLAYELLTGRQPFAGSTPQAQMAAQLTTEPEPVSTSRPGVSAELEALVMRCLKKNPADRWQSAEDLFPYLQALGTPSAELSPLSLTPRRGIRLLLALVGAAAVIAVIIVLGLGLTGDRPLTITTANLVRVTDDPGLEFQPALSPDGREVAYVTGPLSKPRISIRSTVTVDGGEVRVTEGGGDFHLYPAWDPDGESLWFAACEKLNWYLNPCSWRQVGRLGGTIGTLALPRPLDRYAWSREGSRGAFASGDSIFTFRADGGEPHLLAVHEGAMAPNSLAWSPNGRWIAYVEGNNEWRTSGWQRNTSIWMVDANDGTLVQVSDGLNMDLSPQWLPDSRHLLFVSDRDGARGIYSVEVGPDGPVGALQSVLSATDPHSISISHDGRTLAYAKFNQSQQIWAVPLTGPGVASLREARTVTPGNQAVFTPSLSPDENWMAYSTNRQGKQMDIYRVPTTGGTAEVLLDRPWDATGPEWSPDGSELLFRGPVSEDGTQRLQLVSKGGGVEHLLPDFPGALGGQEWSPDALSFVFKGPEGVWTSSRTAVGEPWNDPVQIFDQYCLQPEWSPRGDVVLCWLSPGSDIALLSADGGLIDVLDAQVGRVTSYWNQAFSSDGSLIYFIGREADGSEGFWSLPVTGGQPRKVIAFDDPLVDVEDSFALGRDEVYFVVSEYESDIWVVDLVYEVPD